MAYTNSKLIDVTILSPNHYAGRTCGYLGHDEGIYIFTPHCMAYNGSVESCGNVFKNPTRNASSNYGIDGLGRRGLYVEEKNGSWCSSNRENDMHAITVEIACDDTHPYKMTDKAIESYIELTVDCMKRNKLDKLLYFGSLEKTRDYLKKRKPNEAVMTLHRWFAAKACPGDYFVSKIPYIVDEVNKRVKPPLARLGRLTVVSDYVNVRKEPDSSAAVYKKKEKGSVINVVSLSDKWYKTINGNYVYKDSRVDYESRSNTIIKQTNLFEKQSTGSKVITKIPINSKVLNMQDMNSGWSKIWYNGKVGYVKNSNMKSSFRLSKYVPYTLKKDAWLRKKPSFLVLYRFKKLKKNDTVEFICDYNSKFCQVLYKNKTYYISKKVME